MCTCKREGERMGENRRGGRDERERESTWMRDRKRIMDGCECVC